MGRLEVSPRGPVRPARHAFLLIVLLGAPGASAQTVYKSTMPDGKVVYGEKPAPGASRVDTIEPPPAKTGVTGLTPEEKTRAQQLDRQRAAANAAAAKSQKGLADARTALQQAEAARDAGKEPLPSERIGIAGGGTRLTEAYFARQKSLEQAVATARKRLAESQGR
jgi:hypothetical protein